MSSSPSNSFLLPAWALENNIALSLYFMNPAAESPALCSEFNSDIILL